LYNFNTFVPIKASSPYIISANSPSLQCELIAL